MRESHLFFSEKLPLTKYIREIRENFMGMFLVVCLYEGVVTLIKLDFIAEKLYSKSF